mmetsp:Transcript_3983/g.11986  ORF Transcript_3983/g.11986 Transcript_3983/m.11986 type:complete len:241 (-) Transcript_3983:521-1243(-)
MYASTISLSYGFSTPCIAGRGMMMRPSSSITPWLLISCTSSLVISRPPVCGILHSMWKQSSTLRALLTYKLASTPLALIASTHGCSCARVLTMGTVSASPMATMVGGILWALRARNCLVTPQGMLMYWARSGLLCLHRVSAIHPWYWQPLLTHTAKTGTSGLIPVSLTICQKAWSWFVRSRCRVNMVHCATLCTAATAKPSLIKRFIIGILLILTNQSSERPTPAPWISTTYPVTNLGTW